jgi:hypothetical protein
MKAKCNVSWPPALSAVFVRAQAPPRCHLAPPPPPIAHAHPCNSALRRGLRAPQRFCAPCPTTTTCQARTHARAPACVRNARIRRACADFFACARACAPCVAPPRSGRAVRGARWLLRRAHGQARGARPRTRGRAPGPAVAHHPQPRSKVRRSLACVVLLASNEPPVRTADTHTNHTNAGTRCGGTRCGTRGAFWRMRSTTASCASRDALCLSWALARGCLV